MSTEELQQAYGTPAACPCDCHVKHPARPPHPNTMAGRK